MIDEDIACNKNRDGLKSHAAILPVSSINSAHTPAPEPSWMGQGDLATWDASALLCAGWQSVLPH